MRFDGFYGNTALKDVIANAVEHDAFPSTCLICGASGTGKYTFAKILACALLCTGECERPCGECMHCIKIKKDIHPDVDVFDLGSDEIKVDVAREIRAATSIRPNEANGRVFIIKHMQNMNAAAQNALLKVLEEPPQNVYFILLCENKYALLNTVLSRCLKLETALLNENEMKEVLSARGFTDKNAINEAIRMSEGNAGQAVARLSEPQEDETSPISTARALAFVDAMCEGKELSMCAFGVTLEKLKKQEFLEFLKAALSVLRDALMISCAAEPLCEDTKAQRTASRISRESMLKMCEIIGDCVEMCRFNVGVSHMLGYISAKFYKT